MLAPLIAAVSLLATAANGQAPTVTIDSGVVVGLTTQMPTATAVVNKFLGIPFAQSPPGRFEPPVRESKYKSTLNATKFGDACVQEITNIVTQEIFNNPAPQESEDCLYLNVFAPSTPVAPGNKRAVMFWIYGGSLQFGNAGQPAYDGSWFAAYEDVIVVTSNYRTNVFGFPDAPNQPIKQRNLGFLDQRAGLDWVQRNIAAFGGDPEKVTVFGESAGAFSVDALVTSYPDACDAPFRAAILESGQYGYVTHSNANDYSAWDFLAKQLNCPGKYSDDLACVKAAPWQQIRGIVSNNSLSFTPVVDNVTLIENIPKARRAGHIAKVPIFAGTNAQEGRIFELGQSNITAAIEGLITTNATEIKAIEEAYAVGMPGLYNAYDVISQIFTEYIFQCPQAAMTNDSAYAGIPTWRYYFNASFENTNPLPNLGVYHSSEIPLVFRTWEITDTPDNATVQEYALSQYMQHAWAMFAKNPQGGPGWDAVDVGVEGLVLAGTGPQKPIYAPGGLYLDAQGQRTKGSYNLGVLGNAENVMAAGVTIVPQYSLDYRCYLYEPYYEAIRNAP